eukprot:5457720-Pleurochrysis_carterae.AAC.3
MRQALSSLERRKANAGDTVQGGRSREPSQVSVSAPLKLAAPRCGPRVRLPQAQGLCGCRCLNVVFICIHVHAAWQCGGSEVGCCYCRQSAGSEGKDLARCACISKPKTARRSPHIVLAKKITTLRPYTGI